MSLISALNIGSSALAVSQAAIQTTGNNIANAGNADYVREKAQIVANEAQQIAPGTFLGTGVELTGIQRQVDNALAGRLNSSVSDNQAATTTEQWLGQVQSTFNALNGNDLSSQLSTFYNSWSSLANTPADSGLRQVVLQDGKAVAGTFHTLQKQLSDIQGSVGKSLSAQVNSADVLAGQIATLNGQIVNAAGWNRRVSQHTAGSARCCRQKSLAVDGRYHRAAAQWFAGRIRRLRTARGRNAEQRRRRSRRNW